MTTTLSATAQDQNVRFPLYDHNPIWDKSINSKFVRVMNVVVQLAESFFKSIANVGLRVLNGVHSVLFGSRKVETVAVDVADDADSSIVATVDAVEIDPEEGIPTEAAKGSWLRTSGKIALWATAGVVALGIVAWGANKMGFGCMPGFSRICGKAAEVARKAPTPAAPIGVPASWTEAFVKAGKASDTAKALLTTHASKPCILTLSPAVNAVTGAFTGVTTAETCMKAAVDTVTMNGCKGQDALDAFYIAANAAADLAKKC